MNEEKTKTQSGPGSIQRQTKGDESERQRIKGKFREEIKAIREGHATGGYCDTEKLKASERKLHGVLATELEELKAKFGYSPDPKFKHPSIRAVEVELYGLSYKPELVVKE